MSRLYWPAGTGEWRLGVTSMCGPAWKPANWEVLWPGPLDLRNGNEEIPGAPGQLPRDEEIDQAVIDVQMQVAGGFTQAGVPYANVTNGLRTNLVLLGDLCAPRTPLLVSYLDFPDTALFSAPVQTRLSRPTREQGGGHLLRVTITVTIPQGRHLPVP